MPHSSIIRTASVLGAVTLVACTAGPATAATRPGFDYAKDASYILNMRSAGLEFEDYIPAALHQNVGYSEINLAHDLGDPSGKCEADGAVYWLGQYAEEAVLGAGAAPPDAGDVSGGYHNPLLSRDVKPDIGAGSNLSNRHPAISNYLPPGQEILPVPNGGTPVYAVGKCDSDVKGSGVGNVADLGNAVDLVGSTTASQVDKATGAFSSTSRAYVTGITGAGKLDTIASFMQVAQKPGAQPVVSYRLSFFDSDTGGAPSGLGQNGFTIGGSNIPVDQFVSQFNSQAKTMSGAASAIGPFGFQILAPQTGVTESTEAGTTGLKYISAPAIQGRAGFHFRDGTIGQDQYARFGSITFTGTYNQ